MAPRTTTAHPDAWDRVADAVRLRREELGLTAAQLVDRAGGTPSLAVLSQIENGRKERYASRTLRFLANALGWQPGSIDIILEGGEPVPADPPDDRSLEERLAEVEAEVVRLREALARQRT